LPDRKRAKSDPLHALPAKATRSATAKRDAARRTRDEGYPKVHAQEHEYGADAFDKEVLAREEMEDSTDPLMEAVNRVREPGMSYKFLTERCCTELGMRGYEKVVDAKGLEVKVGEMFLAKIPERIAKRRQERAVAESQERVTEMQDDYSNSVERLKRDAAGLGVRVLMPGENAAAGGATDPGLLGDVRESGIQIQRG
jgi:hypothetical protein